jgi:hypothetical protein
MSRGKIVNTGYRGTGLTSHSRRCRTPHAKPACQAETLLFLLEPRRTTRTFRLPPSIHDDSVTSQLSLFVFTTERKATSSIVTPETLFAQGGSPKKGWKTSRAAEQAIPELGSTAEKSRKKLCPRISSPADRFPWVTPFRQAGQLPQLARLTHNATGSSPGHRTALGNDLKTASDADILFGSLSKRKPGWPNAKARCRPFGKQTTNCDA